MHQIGFAQANKILGRPSSMSAEECGSLEVYSDETYCISRWQLTDEDLEELRKNGGKIYLNILYGGGMPPVKLTVESPFEVPR